ncbi:OprD family outer membrane porin [Pseudomonas sp. N040]|uniref:OprD family outer membrane porin n=1 Tax=Pseudomonas sp. N040 TaxID=2785325 RepID=UPI0018A30103|nr:OprD family outer membrane porin [Pseudomonas sp. N040]MBF7729115.1 OprD family porin [Pseudomonas sp. N040]MBW7012755.1 OprD family porin [Pseudomonas sp. N040]
MKYQHLPLAIALGAIAQQAGAAGFIEDSKATLGLRNFYINQDTRNQDANTQEEWGQGFALNYASGFTEGTIGVGVDALGLLGVKLDSGKGTHYNPTSSKFSGTVFPTDSEGKAVDEFSSLGLTGKVSLAGKAEGRVGTLLPKLPVVVYNDGRLLPQTFEGGQLSSSAITDLTLVGGKLEQAKGRSSSNDTGLSISGANNAQTGQFVNEFWFGGADYKLSKDLLVQYYYGGLEDFYQQNFLGLTHSLALGSGTLKSDLRYFNSASQGKNASVSGRADGYNSSGYWATGDSDKGEVDNNAWSALFTYGIGGHAISAGYQELNGDSNFPYLNQGDGATTYLITDSLIGKFANSEENTWVAQYAYDFSTLGINGLKASAVYLSGDNIASSTGDKQEWERDLRLDYVLADGPLKGLGFTVRNGVQRGNTSTADQDETRLSVNYTLSVL